MPTPPVTTPPAGVRRLVPLLTLNVALAALLAVLWGVSHEAVAQPSSPSAAASRARGNYTMVAGRLRSGSTSAIYIIDAANQDVVALRWNDSRKALEGLGYRNLARDVGQAPGR